MNIDKQKLSVAGTTKNEEKYLQGLSLATPERSFLDGFDCLVIAVSSEEGRFFNTPNYLK